MTNVIPCFSEAQIEMLAKMLGECGTGSDISRILADCQMGDNSGYSTKWKRLHWVFSESQQRYRCANHIIAFIQAFLAPARFAGRADEFEAYRAELNVILAFAGLEYSSDGQFRPCETARTLDQAEKRANTLRSKFQGRRLHPETMKYCRAELLQDNYFHAVFEAAKGLFQRIRGLSGVEADGAALVDKVFSVDRPILAFNSLRTETEKSDHKGFAMLLKGCYGAVRNPMAHEPKILWEGEDDAADFLSLISLMHRRLDNCVRTGL